MHYTLSMCSQTVGEEGAQPWTSPAEEEVEFASPLHLELGTLTFVCVATLILFVYIERKIVLVTAAATCHSFTTCIGFVQGKSCETASSLEHNLSQYIRR